MITEWQVFPMPQEFSEDWVDLLFQGRRHPRPDEMELKGEDLRKAMFRIAIRNRAIMLREPMRDAAIAIGYRHRCAAVPLSRGHISLIDYADVDIVAESVWYADAENYALSRDENRNTIWLHSLILNPEPPLQSDHINRNKLDNRRLNLRPCTMVQNQGNRWKSKHAKTSSYKGVYFCRKLGKFSAYGREGDKNRRLGSFISEVDAAMAYNRWARGYFGEFAFLNQIP